MSTKHEPGSDIDLDAEDVRDAHGQRITEDRAAELAEDALVKVLGRPSLSPPPGTRFPGGQGPKAPGTTRTPRGRSPPAGTSTSSLIREALEHYLAG